LGKFQNFRVVARPKDNDNSREQSSSKIQEALDPSTKQAKQQFTTLNLQHMIDQL